MNTEYALVFLSGLSRKLWAFVVLDKPSIRKLLLEHQKRSGSGVFFDKAQACSVASIWLFDSLDKALDYSRGGHFGNGDYGELFDGDYTLSLQGNGGQENVLMKLIIDDEEFSAELCSSSADGIVDFGDDAKVSGLDAYSLARDLTVLRASVLGSRSKRAIHNFIYRMDKEIQRKAGFI